MADRTCPSCGEPVASHHTVCLACRTPVPSEAGPVGSAATSRIWFAPPPPRQRRVAPATGPVPEAVGTRAPSTSGDDPTAVAPAPGATAVSWVPDDPGTAPGHPAAPGTATETWAPPGPQGTAAAVLDERGNVPAGAVGAIGALLVVVGVFLPWITVGGIDVSGWSASADAKVLVGIAAVGLVVASLLVAGARGLVLRIACLVLGVATVALAAFDIVDASGLRGADLAGGLFVVLVGGVALTLAGLLTRHRRLR